MSKAINGKKVWNVVAAILVLLVVIGLIGLIVKFTGGFTSGFKTFYLTIDGKDIISEANGYKVNTITGLIVDVKYTFDTPTSENKGYSVKIVPHKVEGKDFDFTLNGEAYSYQAEKNLTNGFNINKKDNSFTITPKGGITTILKAVYPNCEISDCTDKSYEDMFSLVVTSYNGKASTIVNFSVEENVTGIEFDKGVIVFWHRQESVKNCWL